MSAEEKQRGIEDAARARAEVYETLDQLQYKLNFARRVDDAVDEAKERIAVKRALDPVGYAAAAAGIAIAAGAIVWGVATAVVRRL